MAERETEEASNLNGEESLYSKTKPVLGMVIVQAGFAGMNIISKVALSHGMSFYVLVVYRHAVATLTLAPFALFLERKNRPSLGVRVLLQLFVNGLIGCTLTQFLYYAGMEHVAPAFLVALVMSTPAVTCIIALPLRLERVDVRSAAGKAKLTGTAVTIGGGMVITFYKGRALNFWKPLFHLDVTASSSSSRDPLKGALFGFASCLGFSFYCIIQTKIGNKYPAQYTSTAILCFFVTIQSAFWVLVWSRTDFSVWKLGWDSKLLASIYSGMVATGLSFTLMSWCIRKKGPLVVTMFTPVQLILVALLDSVFLDDKLHLGSILGSVLIVVGVYLVVWGKSKEARKQPNQSAQSDVNGYIQEECSEDGHVRVQIPKSEHGRRQSSYSGDTDEEENRAQS